MQNSFYNKNIVYINKTNEKKGLQKKKKKKLKICFSHFN